MNEGSTAAEYAERSDSRRGAPRVPLVEIGITLLGVALLGLLVLAVAPLREAVSAAVHGDNAEVRHQIDRLGAGGPLLILGLALIHAVVFYPAEIVDAAAGFAYGFLPALALAMLGWVVSGLLCFAVGHSVARPLLDRWLGEERFERIEAMIERGGPSLLLAMRLIPILPFSIVSYAAGAARVPVWRFTWTTAVGYLPITAIAAYFGTRLEGLSLTDPVVFLSAAGLLALLGAGHWAMRRQARRGSRRSAQALDAEAEDHGALIDEALGAARLDPEDVAPDA